MSALTSEEMASLLGDELAAAEARNRDAAKWRVEAHLWFDLIWKGGHLSRPGAYVWLGKSLKLKRPARHIALLDVDQCKRVVDLAKDFLASRKGIR